MSYVATTNIPGYLPMDDEPPVFDTVVEAWDWLARERRIAENDLDDESDSYSDTVLELEANSLRTMADGSPYNFTGTVYGKTPGSDSEWDLGIAYTVDWAFEGSENE